MRFIFLLLLSCNLYAFAITDDHGVVIHPQKSFQRVISLAPDITEILFAIGAEKKLIGVIHGSDYPSQAKQIPEVGSYTGLDLERIIALKPDLIITWHQGFYRQLSVLKKLGIPIYTTEPKRLEDIARTITNLGLLTHSQKKANALAQKFLIRLNETRDKYQHRPAVTVFFQIGAYSLLTINKSSWINQVIEICGGRNIFAETTSLVPEISWESMIRANPQVIITDATQASWKKRWQRWPNLLAVKNHLLFSIPPDCIDRAGPRLLQGLGLMCSYLDKARTSYKRV